MHLKYKPYTISAIKLTYNYETCRVALQSNDVKVTRYFTYVNIIYFLAVTE